MKLRAENKSCDYLHVLCHLSPLQNTHLTVVDVGDNFIENVDIWYEKSHPHIPHGIANTTVRKKYFFSPSGTFPKGDRVLGGHSTRSAIFVQLTPHEKDIRHAASLSDTEVNCIPNDAGDLGGCKDCASLKSRTRMILLSYTVTQELSRHAR